MKMYHVHFTDVTFFTIEKIHYYMGSFPFLIFTLLTCSVHLFFFVMHSVYHYIYDVKSYSFLPNSYTVTDKMTDELPDCQIN